MSRSSACDWVHKLTPYLSLTLIKVEAMPARHFDDPEALKEACQGVERILIDVTEREIQRPVDETTQREHYSGKHREHTVGNTIIASPKKVVLFVGATFAGRHHDYAMLKAEFPPDQPWFKELTVLVDLGYHGILTDYDGHQVGIPFKKLRKSKANPDPQLTDLQKMYNCTLSSLRIYVENAIAGFKKFNILVHDFRNRKGNFCDLAIAIAAGLWNFSIT